MVDCSKILEKGSEHPQSFVVDLNTSDHQILCLEIPVLFGDVACFCDTRDDGFVALDEMSDVVFRGDLLDRKFRDRGKGSQVLQASWGVRTEGANTLGYIIDGDKEFFILGLKCRMQREEGGSFDIPVSNMSLAE